MNMNIPTLIIIPYREKISYFCVFSSPRGTHSLTFSFSRISCSGWAVLQAVNKRQARAYTIRFVYSGGSCEYQTKPLSELSKVVRRRQYLVQARHGRRSRRNTSYTQYTINNAVGDVCTFEPPNSFPLTDTQYLRTFHVYFAKYIFVVQAVVQGDQPKYYHESEVHAVLGRQILKNCTRVL